MVVDLNKIDPNEALQFAVGQYVKQFGNLETIVSSSVAKTLQLDAKLTFFMLKDVFVSQKINLLRRAVIQRYGDNKTTAIRAILNKINTASEFRNNLVHGVFIAQGSPEASLSLGKLGRALDTLMQGIEPIDYKNIQKETMIAGQLCDFLIEAMESLNTSNSNNLEKSGSGSK